MGNLQNLFQLNVKSLQFNFEHNLIDKGSFLENRFSYNIGALHSSRINDKNKKLGSNLTSACMVNILEDVKTHFWNQKNNSCDMTLFDFKIFVFKL